VYISVVSLVSSLASPSMGRGSLYGPLSRTPPHPLPFELCGPCNILLDLVGCCVIVVCREGPDNSSSFSVHHCTCLLSGYLFI